MKHSVRQRIKGMSAAIAALGVALLVNQSAYAWKPNTHVYAANIAVQSIYAGYNTVNINGTNYPVDPVVANAIRNYPDYYRAGVIGPDAYPDIYVGQAFIHPDTRNNNGNGPWEAADGHSFTYEWLRHVYESGWAQYNADNGAKGQKALAFAYGYLTHAAGDMWAHSFVNDFADGVFPDVSDVLELPIAGRHIVVESYVGKWTPSTTMSIPNQSTDLRDFIFNTLMIQKERGGFEDSAGNDAKKLGRGGMFDFFFDLRDSLRTETDWLWNHPELAIIDPAGYISVLAYCEFWIDDIDEGMQEWPMLSQEIAYQLFTQGEPGFDAALSAVGDFVSPQLIEMIGVPDPLALFIDVFVEVFGLFGDLIEPLANEAIAFADYMCQQSAGFSFLELRDYLITPENHINSFPGLSPNTSLVLDGLMGRSGSNPFNPNTFAPMHNTIVTSKMILMSPAALNQLLNDNRVGAMYQSNSQYSDRDNVMLGFIKTLDGNQQWRKHTSANLSNNPAGNSHGEGMPLWTDCVSRNRLFRNLFMDWQNGGQSFPDLGEAGEQLSDTPNPVAMSMTIQGPNVVVGGVTYVGANTTFKLDANSSYFWNTNEINAHGQILPFGSAQAALTTLTVGPATGPDQTYNLSFYGTGVCPGGPNHTGPTSNFSFVLDSIAPEITIANPIQGVTYDVNFSTVYDMNVFDAGSGVDSQSATLDGAAIADGATIDTFLLDAGVHTIVVNAVDKIGNDSSLTRTFEVRATILGLKSAVTRAYNTGLITRPTTPNALQQQLEAAQKAFLKGQFGTAKNKIAAARDLVSGQLDNGVEMVFGTRFIGWCNDLINRL